jgi:CheY-like chemotaxis protein
VIATPTILLAEDDRFLRKAAETTLRKRGYRVVVAADGEEALARAVDARPDLILLDVIMPKVQGFEVLARLKRAASTAHIPVLMLTNLGQDTDRDEALRLGAAAYIVKSNVKLEELAEQVGDVLARQS